MLLFAVVWAVALGLMLILYARMLTGVRTVVPARTNWAMRSTGIKDGSDSRVRAAFGGVWVLLLMLNWLGALIWLGLLAVGIEILRRHHNNATQRA